MHIVYAIKWDDALFIFPKTIIRIFFSTFRFECSKITRQIINVQCSHLPLHFFRRYSGTYSAPLLKFHLSRNINKFYTILTLFMALYMYISLILVVLVIHFQCDKTQSCCKLERSSIIFCFHANDNIFEIQMKTYKHKTHML